ncbi:hypothetical protein I862_00055 [endosymbiont of Acanthamoeba sp. UWC8]|uniref:TlpA family protein disulfide reductase n=1 Tax=endosymbiont of Acanthamoeba sp. UWC8 TaxID=86106 RepID=UPI0004D0FEFA|nr:TlpA disulfide reductase family protein [endosymbiont of Acanthamoeba sp. UWC8]AIF80576.1 hypothetical protein I862_00055 [endosymbiont of Acanthamoeba sp. UWC8]
MKNLKIIFAILLFNLLLSLKAYAFELKEIMPSQFPGVVESKNIRLIYIFTSWCSVCKRVFPEVVELYKDFDPKDVDIMLISLDDNDEVVNDAFKLYKDQNFVIYRINQDSPQEVMQGLLKAGILYKGSVPHSTIIDEKDNIVVNGSYKIHSLKKAVEYLIKNK